MDKATRTIPRRNILQAALAGAGAAAWRPARAQAPVQLSLAIWGGQAEEDAIGAALARYQQAHPNVTVKLEISGAGGQFYQQLDTRLAGRQAPDLFRVQYQQVGRYAAARAAIDLSKYLPAETADAFQPAFWRAVTFKDRVHALPHHTDTFAVYVNRAMLQKAGAAMPSSPAEAWTWAEFIRIARAMQAAGAPYGFAMSWQNQVAYRWMPFLYQHGGQMLTDDLSRSAMSDLKAAETIAWCQSWFKEGLVPPSTSIKSAEQPQNLFANGTIGMLIGGNWQIPFLSKAMKDEWDVTYMPRDAGTASDLGGNALAISRDCKQPEAAADLLRFLTDEANTESFVIAAQFLPVRKALSVKTLGYRLRPDAMEVFLKQTATVPEHMVATQTLSNFSRMNAKLADELDLAFTSGQDPAATARNIDAQLQAILGA